MQPVERQGVAMGWQGPFVKLGDWVALACKAIAAMSLLVIVLVNGVNVAGRYLFSSPLAWGEELMVYLMILTVFSASVPVTWRNRHIRIDIFLHWLPPTVRIVVTCLTSIIAIVALVYIVRSSFLVVSMLLAFGQLSEALDLPLWIPQGVVTIGLALNALLFLIRLVTWSGADGEIASTEG